MADRSARFFPGQQVQHLLFNYRGVIFDIDPIFLGNDQWYEQMASTRPPKEDPWYHVLVHGEEHTTYVAERNLTEYLGEELIDHPLVEAYFDDVKDGVYHSRIRSN